MSDDNPFAGPEPIPTDQAMVRRALTFALRRAVRLGSGPLFLALWAVYVFGADRPGAVLGAWLTGLLLWLPTTWVQARIVFLPSPPDPWLFDPEGETVSAHDTRLWWRSVVTDDALGTAMALGAGLTLLSMAGIPEGMRTVLRLAAIGLIAAQVAHRAVALGIHEAALDLLAGDHRKARRRLERLARLSWLELGGGAAVWYHLARARFRDGDLDGALAALDRVRGGLGWPVKVLQAQMTIGRDGTAAARAVAASLREDPRRAPDGLAMAALAAVHDGADAEAIALGDEIGRLPRGEDRRFASLLLAAAEAAGDPARAARTLEREGWTWDQARTAAAPWPPVAARIDRLAAAVGPGVQLGSHGGPGAGRLG